MGATDKARLAETRTDETKRFIRDIRRVTRRRFTAEEKIRIVLEGFRHDTPIRDLCRREGIRPTTYYAWLKEFMEAGKERLQNDTTRDATKTEVDRIKRENVRLKQLVAELSLQVHVLKKRRYQSWNKGEVCSREWCGEERGSGSGGRFRAVPAAGAVATWTA